MITPELTPIDLVNAFYAKGLSEAEGMNLLQDNGVVSDNCVWAGSVAYKDLPRAIEFINNNWPK